jgi:hypothetical protein
MRLLIVLEILAGVSYASSVSAQTAQQFDLVCDGTATTIAHGTPFKGVDTPFHQEWIVDLKRGEYCALACPSVMKIADVSDSEIVLWDRDAQQVTEKGTFVRATDQFESLTQKKGLLDNTVVVAKCARTSFKGLPEG